MLKEIHEQGLVLAETFRGRINIEEKKVSLGDVSLSSEDVKGMDRIVLAAEQDHTENATQKFKKYIQIYFCIQL